MARLRVQFTNCVFHDHALRPSARPFPEHPALLNAILKTSDKATFCLLGISRKKKGELIETIEILLKDSPEILAARVSGCGVFTVGLLRHFFTYRERRVRSPAIQRHQMVYSGIQLHLRAWQGSASRRRHAQ